MVKSSSTSPRPPRPGDVIAFEYLWSHERDVGLFNGVKTRHCVIVRVLDNGLVVIVPITGTKPTHANIIELRGGVLGLARASWIVTSDINITEWPGPDIRPAHPSQGAWWRYGSLSPSLRNKLFDALQDGLKRNVVAVVKRY